MQKRIREYGIIQWRGETGPLNKITDIPGVTVGHCTLREQEHRTGVTVIVPCEDNMFQSKLCAASFVMNGFGKTAGLVQINELGSLETPIALTNTLCVGRVSDAVVGYMAGRCREDHVEMHSINPVVGECNDASFNRITDRPIQEIHVLQAIDRRCRDFEEGNVGAGTGTICHGLKGGVGSASRIIRVDGQAFTIGVLVQSNHGCLEKLQIGTRPVGQEILAARRKEKTEKNAVGSAAEGQSCERQGQSGNAAGDQSREECDQGSIMMIVGTDLPVSDRQLQRILRRCSAGLARLGSYFGHGSGDVMIGFSTANRIPSTPFPSILTQRVVSENVLEQAFSLTADATEEAVLNSLVCASGDITLEGTYIASLREYLDA